MNPLKKVYYIFRYLGPRIVWLRARIYLANLLGITRRTYTPLPWEQIDLARITIPGTPTNIEAYARFKADHQPPFLFSLGQPPEMPAALRQADQDRKPSFSERLKLLAEDRCVYFFNAASPSPIDWHVNPFNGKRSDPDLLWCESPDFLATQGDIRSMWEPARAAWAIDLARARAHGLEPRAASLFWRWVDSWMAGSPPFMGVHWKCGQECSVRMTAIALGFWSLANDPATTPQRWLQFARLAWATGYRVYHHINYAISQKNNHAISEACVLLLISHLFPEFRESARWQAKGRKVLAGELSRQIYDDGSYVQQSMNYHRVMLQGALLALRLAELAHRPFEPDIYKRLGQSAEFLFQMMDPQTGRLPQYGHNDGALILPLNECDFNDYRPVIQAAYYLVKGQRLLPPGAWDEDLLWLFGPRALSGEPASGPRAVSSAFEAGGYYTLRGKNSWAMIRCHTYRDRPGHFDQLHLDLWWREQNVLQDCGTYQYYIPERPDLEGYFKSIAAHNTVEIDGCDPFEYVSRFLYLPWPRGRKRHFAPTGPSWFEGEHYDYTRLPGGVLHRRTVISIEGDAWIIIDDLLGDGEHGIVLRWHMIDVPYELASSMVTLKTLKSDLAIAVASHPGKIQSIKIVRGCDEPGKVQGFTAPYYAGRLPIPVLEAGGRYRLPQRMITTVSPQKSCSPRFINEEIGRQRWEVVTFGKKWSLELAALRREVDRTFISCMPVNRTNT